MILIPYAGIIRIRFTGMISGITGSPEIFRGFRSATPVCMF
jgi:hypothetical protein